jgi:hypothetical protein
MSRRRPPVLALWLLERQGFARGNSPLMGDLLEEFRGGRSALWFWRQTLTVIANCVGRHAALLQTYWIAVAAGFAAQLSVSFLLFRLRVPPAVHGWGSKTAAFLLAIIAMSLLPSLERRLFGKTSQDLKSILVMPCAGVIEGRGALMGATAFESFACILLLYCLCCAMCPSGTFSSYAGIAGYEIVWLGAGEFGSEVMWAARRLGETRRAERESRKAEQREWEERAWVRLNELDVSLICSDGTIVVLAPETCMETIFASANEELIQCLFTGGTSLEQIRRGIWLARAAEYGWPMSGPISRPVPVWKFARLLGPGTESDRMMQYMDVRPAGSLPRRLMRRLVAALRTF